MFKARSLLATAAAGLSLAAAPAAAAAPALNLSGPIAMPLVAAGMSGLDCGAPQAAPVSKASAILGVEMSALERMRLQQEGASAAPEPALAPTAACAAESFAIAKPAGQFLGTERVAIGKTRFDRDWNRALRKTVSERDAVKALGSLPTDRRALLSRVNGWVNDNIAYRSDGRRDKWADARTTLRKGYGDCEDYAILKMQLLAASGVRKQDMMLTLARDTMRQVDHAVLLVRVDGAYGQDEWVMLDMQSDRVESASYDYGYRAIMSFAADQSYLHGKAYAPRPNLALR
ncbi:transglutaminase-like cysteine peptidase [Altererythrobacter lutimaris]|uniref:Transglutaminase-like cysteine peptidase n=1 Tax=Altererythrobacter lutimaris TaxID=2743979 RepID=A0A850HC34_9SPHN|nr:transglutaminase-like cysteine peptidase [Altererythrobacter lutimaris]NVE94168.1 transglutaminase-like cysteine peptidase [Altererythrobacter lutimaris]